MHDMVKFSVVRKLETGLIRLLILLSHGMSRGARPWGSFVGYILGYVPFPGNKMVYL